MADTKKGMIQANELRIGNYFRGIGGIQTVLALNENTNGLPVFVSKEHKQAYSHLILCHQNGNQYKPFEVEPIPLTEEILLKCNLKFDTDGFWHLTENVLFKDSDIVSIKGYQPYSFNLIDEVNSFGVKIINLHQLQNLFHALTGQELTIEL